MISNSQIRGIPGASLGVVLLIIIPFYLACVKTNVSLLPFTWLFWAFVVSVGALSWILFVSVIISRISDRAGVWVDAACCGFLVAVAFNHVFLFDMTSSTQLNGKNLRLSIQSSIGDLSAVVFILIAAGVAFAARHGRRRLVLISAATILACSSTIIGQAFQGGSPFLEKDELAPDFNSLSRKKNIIHLLPDSMQADAVIEVLDADKAFREKFKGFRLFPNHIGMFPFTAPSLTTMMTGAPHDLTKGYVLDEVEAKLDDESITTELAKDGFRIHYVGLGKYFCGTRYVSCVVANFGQLEAPDVGNSTSEDIWNLALLLDLSALRAAPVSLSQAIFSSYQWPISSRVRRHFQFSLTPDPLIVDWARSLTVDDSASPRYYFYHYIGTHRPLRWDGNCRRMAQPSISREAQLGQTRCVLQNIAALIDRLRELGVYDQTAFVISADHGTGILGGDTHGDNGKFVVDRATIAVARPILMVKSLNDQNDLLYSNSPTSVIDIPDILLSLAKTGDWRDEPKAPRVRTFRFVDSDNFHYDRPDFVPSDAYIVPDDPTHGEKWQLFELQRKEIAPPALIEFTAEDIARFQRGSLSGGTPLRDGGGAWVDRQMDVLISAPEGANTLIVEARPFSEGTKISVALNGRPLIQGRTLKINDPGQWMIRNAICVGQSNIMTGNNHVSLSVSGGAQTLFGDVRFVRSPNC
ncbi:sulfatase-like hydrolase/transferase [Bosea sp. (in: a-proteobacteria)]|jgi:hypothetical protein|uniref:sulfatase-like hydrolase/transferase n=1 Tax=Bosea sp. (in: a-proteobacteria) TaxID=1871050 RepID=UPI002DDD518E|nr:sulfatase-like hydrolase/transferase [Bosea sp. (in: a-proteobacteria)]HEV2510143.1 sulfatase-like hydrolase/transferase [Bosea sp. (in: a-proteobacteria)]